MAAPETSHYVEGGAHPGTVTPSASFRYVPVLRYRQEERLALRALLPYLSQKIMPLLELVFSHPSSSSGTFQGYKQALASLGRPFMVDFPLYMTIISGSNAKFAQFVGTLKKNPALRLKYFTQLRGIPGLIPVISYDFRTPQFVPHHITALSPLRQAFPRVAFRIFTQHWAQALQQVAGLLRPGDILIFDIDEVPVQNNTLQSAYQQITQIARQAQAHSCLVRSVIPRSLVNHQLPHAQPYLYADDSLKSLYKQLGFDSFGDYAGIKRDDTVRDGGEVSPGFLFYSWHNSYYLAFRGTRGNIKSFQTIIAPAIIASAEWHMYGPQHHSQCPGCARIRTIATQGNPGNQGLWKRIAVMHYIYTMEELLP